MTVTESDGSVRTWRQAFSALPVMQRPGGLRYEVTAGRYNGGVTQGSKGATFALGSLVYGLPHNITLTHTGRPLPFGSVVTLSGDDGGQNTGIVGDAGQVWLSGLPSEGKLTASWGQGQCGATFNLEQAQVSAHNPVRVLSVRCEEQAP